MPPSGYIPLMLAGLSRPDLWRHAAFHCGVLKHSALLHAAGGTLGIRRTASQGLAVLTAMIRRLIHLMAKEIPLAPVCPRGTESGPHTRSPRLQPRAFYLD